MLIQLKTKLIYYEFVVLLSTIMYIHLWMPDSYTFIARKLNFSL